MLRDAILQKLKSREIKAFVIGTSAGGVEALIKLLPLFKKTDFSVFVVLHLPSHAQSLMPFILEGKLQMKIKEAESSEIIEPGIIYLAPPDYHLSLERNLSVSLSNEELVNYSRPSIDVLFSSAAAAYKDKLAGIILTGANHDGAQGVSDIKRYNGLVLVQNPLTADFPEMPQAAINKCVPDAVLNFDEICSVISALT